MKPPPPVTENREEGVDATVPPSRGFTESPPFHPLNQERTVFGSRETGFRGTIHWDTISHGHLAEVDVESLRRPCCDRGHVGERLGRLARLADMYGKRAFRKHRRTK